MRTSPGTAVHASIGAIFVPVRDIESARDWYVKLLEPPTAPDVLLEHLAVFPLSGGSSNLVLDSRIHRTGEHRSTPLFHFNADDAERARDHVQAVGGSDVSSIQHGHWFTFADPDGNVLMVRAHDRSEVS